MGRKGRGNLKRTLSTGDDATSKTSKSTASINGQQVAQTFLNSQDGWLSQVGLFFSRKAASGDVQWRRIA